MNKWKRCSVVALYAIAMAWVESAVVLYLRTMVDRIEPYQPNPLPMATGFGQAELVREAATLIMLLTVGILAGKSWRSRIGYTVIAFGIWDIFYYVFLKVLCGWPHSLLDWDILFLIPLPWWGPVIAPAAISLLMILWGTLAIAFETPRPPSHIAWKSWSLCLAGMLLALGVFMADNLRVLDGGVNAWRKVLPTKFNWSLFCAALLLLAAPVIENLLWIARRRLMLERVSSQSETGLSLTSPGT